MLASTGYCFYFFLYWIKQERRPYVPKATIKQHETDLMEVYAETRCTMVMYGQELNPESYAICKADMLIKGQDVAICRVLSLEKECHQDLRRKSIELEK